jgi:hypothetical protein
VGKNTSAASYLGSSEGDYANDQSLLCVHIPRLGIRIFCCISDLYTLFFPCGGEEERMCWRLKGSIKFDVRSFYDAQRRLVFCSLGIANQVQRLLRMLHFTFG